MKDIHYEVILQSLTEDLLRRDAKIKDLERRYNDLKAVHAKDVDSHWQKDCQKDRKIKELQSSIDKLTNEKEELTKRLQNSSLDKKEDSRQKNISECVNLVNQIYDFCKEHNLKFSMDFENDRNDPGIIIWDYTGNISLCHVVYDSDWITTLKILLTRVKNGYEMWVIKEGKDDIQTTNIDLIIDKTCFSLSIP